MGLKKSTGSILKSMARSDKIEQGDYVMIKEGVHDENLPFNRRDGLVTEVVGDKNDQIIVMFHNLQFLKFHKSQVTVLVKV